MVTYNKEASCTLISVKGKVLKMSLGNTVTNCLSSRFKFIKFKFL